MSQLHARMLASNQQERETAYAELLALLEENRKTLNDVQGLLAEAINISDVGDVCDEPEERGGLIIGGDGEQANALQAIVMTLEAHCERASTSRWRCGYCTRSSLIAFRSRRV